MNDSTTLWIEFDEVGAMNITLEVTAKGQITLCNEVVNHLGVRPGDKLDVDLLTGGRIRLRPRRGISAASVFGMLTRPGTPFLSVEEINRVAASGWADQA